MECDDSLIGSFADVEAPRAVTGELRLIAAVLEVAVGEARRGDPEALAWLASDQQPGAALLTYREVCEHLGAEPARLRTMIAAFIAANPYVWRPRRIRRALEHAAAA